MPLLRRDFLTACVLPFFGFKKTEEEKEEEITLLCGKIVILERKDGKIWRYREDINNGSRYYKNGILHREDGPAVDLRCEKVWLVDGVCHRVDGPASILTGSYGERREYWYRNGVMHRENDPAAIHYRNNKVVYESWYLQGKLYFKMVSRCPPVLNEIS